MTTEPNMHNIQTQFDRFDNPNQLADTILSKYERMTDRELKDGKYYIPQDFYDLIPTVNKDRQLAERWDALYNRFVEVQRVINPTKERIL